VLARQSARCPGSEAGEHGKHAAVAFRGASQLQLAEEWIGPGFDGAWCMSLRFGGRLWRSTLSHKFQDVELSTGQGGWWVVSTSGSNERRDDLRVEYRPVFVISQWLGDRGR